LAIENIREQAEEGKIMQSLYEPLREWFLDGGNTGHGCPASAF
jgi:hypothetical protein